MESGEEGEFNPKFESLLEKFSGRFGMDLVYVTEILPPFGRLNDNNY